MAYVLAIIYVLISLDNESDTYWDAALFFGIIGTILYIISICRRKKAEKRRKYLTIIQSGVFSLESIADAMGNSYEDTYVDLEKIIGAGALKSAYINDKKKEIVVPGLSLIKEQTEQTAETSTVKCPFCGAPCEIQGEAGQCSYCGSTIKI